MKYENNKTCDFCTKPCGNKWCPVKSTGGGTFDVGNIMNRMLKRIESSSLNELNEKWIDELGLDKSVYIESSWDDTWYTEHRRESISDLLDKLELEREKYKLAIGFVKELLSEDLKKENK